MRLSSKHQNQQTVEIYDFSGGLNTSVVEEQIADNQLAECVNFDIQPTSGLLKTVAGTSVIIRFPSLGFKFISAAYDALNQHVVLFAENGNIYSAPVTNLETFTQIGTLTGSLVPVTLVWEDGLLVASGGKLQYIIGSTMKTIATSPDVCKGVYTRSGRIIVFDDDNIRYSGVGDEENWTEDSNDASSSVWVEAGYKVGGRLIGMVNMSSDILMIKDNGRILRLSGEYPDWQITEVARNVDCNNHSSFCTAVNDVYIFGGSTIQKVVTTQEYGDMRAQNIASAVEKNLLQFVRNDTKLRYLPALNQIWIINNTENVLMFDLNVNAFYSRRFNAPVTDALCISTNTFVVREDGVDLIDATSYTDEGEFLDYRLKFKTRLSHYDFLIKRLTWVCTGVGESYHNVILSLGNTITIYCPVGKNDNGDIHVVNNFQPVYHNAFKLRNAFNRAKRIIYSNRGPHVYRDFDVVKYNPDYVLNAEAFYVSDQKLRYRAKDIFFVVSGKGCQFAINKIKYDVVEV